jgi:hypothetical protein
MGDFHEPDWKTLRSLQPVLLERLCTRIMDELRGVMDDAGMTAHQRYLKLFKLLDERNDEVAAGFDDMRRSRALMRLANIYALGLFTDEELERFTPQTRDSFVGLAQMYRDARARQRR